MDRLVLGALLLAMAIIAVLVVPAGTISVSAVKPSGGVREVIPPVIEPQQAQRNTQE